MNYVEPADEAAVRAYVQGLSQARELVLACGITPPSQADLAALLRQEAHRIAKRKRLSRLGWDQDYDRGT